MNNAVIVPGGQQRDSAIYIHVFILPQTPPLIQAAVSHGAELPVDTGGPWWSPILNIAVCTSWSQNPSLSPPTILPHWPL